MSKTSPALDATLEEVKLGQSSWKYYYRTKIRNIAWSLASALGAAIAAITGILLAQHFVQGILGSDGAQILAQYGALTLYLVMAGWAGWMIRTMHVQDSDQQPMFDEEPITKFQPRDKPTDGNWDAWLRKGVRIGRWQQDSKGNRPGPAAWMPIKGMPGILVAGESGQGKSTFVWNVLYELEPAIDDDVVLAFVFDYKAGMELDGVTKLKTRSGKPIVRDKNFHCGEEVGTNTPICDGWDRFGEPTYMKPRGEVWGYEETAIPHLRRYVWILRARAASLRGTGREHHPKAGDQHYVGFLDEAAVFARDHVPNWIQDEISGLIDTIANQGRAIGFTEAVCTQYPSLEYIKFRHGLLWGLALKVKTPRACDMVLGEGAWLSGKRADKLPRDERHPGRFAGIGYMSQSGAFGAMPLRLVSTGPDLNNNGIPDGLEENQDQLPERKRLEWDDDDTSEPSSDELERQRVRNLYPAA